METDGRLPEGTARREVALFESEAECERLRGQLAEAEKALGRALRRVDHLKSTIERAVQEAAWAEMRLQSVENSTVWKATWPMRRLSSRWPSFSKRFRQGLQIIWWSATLQLPSRLRTWRTAQRGRVAPYIAFPPELIDEAPDPASIVLQTSAPPTVSVLIPTYGQVDYTLRCLASIAANTPTTPFEVIVSEDASGDTNISGLRSVQGLRLIEQPHNLGFLGNSNSASTHALGEYLLFLNNDVQVTENWLDSLVDLIRTRSDAGAVGSKLIYPDGRLQEAGGIIWNDGSGWNYGRLDHPDIPVYNYVREVDYISGAALLIRRDLFVELGGFDDYYAPAYYEDTDLSFKIRERGLKVLYQPRSIIVHFEGISHGTDLDTGIKANQRINRVKFEKKWREVLQREHFANATHELRAREHGFNRRVILVIDHYVPEPDRDAGSRLILGYLRAFLTDGWIVKFWPDNGAYRPGYTEALQDLGVEVLYGPDIRSFEAWIPTNGIELDAVIVSRPDVADKYISRLRLQTKCRIFYLGHDLHFARLNLQASTTGDQVTRQRAAAMEALERSIWRRADLSIYPSDEEAETVRKIEPDAAVACVMPFAFDEFGSIRTVVQGHKILFVAGFGHPPNEDGAVWLIENIFPHIIERVPDARISIVGSNPTARVRNLADGKQPVELHPNVTDKQLAEFYQSSRVTVVPLRFGAGVKLKVIEALKEGVPLVTTPVGAQGCHALSEIVPVIADEVFFAEAVCELLLNDDAWEQASERQLAYARANFSREALSQSLRAVFDA